MEATGTGPEPEATRSHPVPQSWGADSQSQAHQEIHANPRPAPMHAPGSQQPQSRGQRPRHSAEEVHEPQGLDTHPHQLYAPLDRRHIIVTGGAR